jgi:hypothetical protein
VGGGGVTYIAEDTLISGATHRCSTINFHEALGITGFATDATLTKQATLVYFILTLETVFYLKGQGPLDFKKNKCQAAQWEIISYLFISLLTQISFRCTVHLTLSYTA